MRTDGPPRLVRWGIVGATAALMACLAAAALAQRDGGPGGVGPGRGVPAALVDWFARPTSVVLITIAVVMLTASCVVSFHSGRASRMTTPIARCVAGLTAVNFVLAMSSYWRCHDAAHPAFYTPLLWTIGLLKGGVDDRTMSGTRCPTATPVALEVARLSAMAAILVGIGGVVIALGQSQLDRFRVRLDRSVTVVVGLDDDAMSMIRAVRATLDDDSRLVVVTEMPDRACVAAARQLGARVVLADFARPATLASLTLWSKLDRLYLLAPDPSANLARLRVIADRRGPAHSARRVPLITRIDDPWQAQEWRARHFGGTDARWAADAVGKYEITARRLLDEVVADPAIARVIVCGASPLTLSLCAELAQRHREAVFGGHPDGVPAMTLVGPLAQEYQRDHEFHQRQLGHVDAHPIIDAVGESISMHTLSRLVDAHPRGPRAQAVIFVDAAPAAAGAAALDATVGTRLAVRYPRLPVHAWDPAAPGPGNGTNIVGRLIGFGLSMDLPDGAAQDAWERAARLIHERYAGVRAAAHTAADEGRRSEIARPWQELDEFHRRSNRRQVRTALSVVESIGLHAWNSSTDRPVPLPDPAQHQGKPLELLERLGFDRTCAIAMARAEHDDWCAHLRGAGWRWGPHRDDARRVHDKLLAWDDPRHTAEFKDSAYDSLAGTLMQLAMLGYRSTPVTWHRYRRTGVVTATQRLDGWTWRTANGDTLTAEARDWEVSDEAGSSWSVRDHVFRANHEHVGGAWRRTGFIMARPARTGERIDTLEGFATAGDGDFVVRDDDGRQWPVPADQFAKRYDGPVPEDPRQ